MLGLGCSHVRSADDELATQGHGDDRLGLYGLRLSAAGGHLNSRNVLGIPSKATAIPVPNAPWLPVPTDHGTTKAILSYFYKSIFQFLL